MNNAIIRYGTFLIVSIICLFSAHSVISSDSPSVGSIAVLPVSLICLLVILFGDRIAWFDLSKLRVQMKEVENTKEEIEKIALGLSEMFIFNAAFIHRLGTHESAVAEQKWMEARVRELLKDLEINSPKKSDLFRHLDGIRELDAIPSEDREARKDKWSELWKRVAEEST